MSVSAPALQGVIEGDRPCGRCGYNLRGLSGKGVCPECGEAIRAARRYARFADNLTDAPMWYLRWLAGGLSLMAFAVVAMVLLTLVVGSGFGALLVGGAGPRVVSLALMLGASASWALGVLCATRRRPLGESTVRDVLLESARFRVVVRVFALAPAAATLAGFGALAAPGPLDAAFLGLVVLGLIAALFGIVPQSVYLASLADWSGSGSVADGLRVSAWGVAVGGALSIGGLLLSALPTAASGVFALVGIACAGITLLSVLVFLASVLLLAHTSAWAIRNSEHARVVDRRRAERERRDAARREAAWQEVGAPPAPAPRIDGPCEIDRRLDALAVTDGPGVPGEADTVSGAGGGSLPLGPNVIPRAEGGADPYELADDDDAVGRR